MLLGIFVRKGRFCIWLSQEGTNLGFLFSYFIFLFLAFCFLFWKPFGFPNLLFYFLFFFLLFPFSYFNFFCARPLRAAQKKLLYLLLLFNNKDAANWKLALVVKFLASIKFCENHDFAIFAKWVPISPGPRHFWEKFSLKFRKFIFDFFLGVWGGPSKLHPDTSAQFFKIAKNCNFENFQNFVLSKVPPRHFRRKFFQNFQNGHFSFFWSFLVSTAFLLGYPDILETIFKIFKTFEKKTKKIPTINWNFFQKFYFFEKISKKNNQKWHPLAGLGEQSPHFSPKAKKKLTQVTIFEIFKILKIF